MKIRYTLKSWIVITLLLMAIAGPMALRVHQQWHFHQTVGEIRSVITKEIYQYVENKGIAITKTANGMGEIEGSLLSSQNARFGIWIDWPDVNDGKTHYMLGEPGPTNIAIDGSISIRGFPIYGKPVLELELDSNENFNPENDMLIELLKTRLANRISPVIRIKNR